MNYVTFCIFNNFIAYFKEGKCFPPFETDFKESKYKSNKLSNHQIKIYKYEFHHKDYTTLFCK